MNTRKTADIISSTWISVAVALVLLLPFAILFGLVFKSIPVLSSDSILHLLTSPDWQPMLGKFGFLPFIISSVFVTLIGLLIMIPLGIFPSLWLTQYAPPGLLRIMRSVIDVLAGIPSVIHGVWGIIVVVPLVAQFIGPLLGKDTSGYTLLSGGTVLAVSVIPFVLHMLLEVFRSIPVELKEASLSLGASYWETLRKVVLRKAMPGILAAYALGISRAFGETIAVLMVVGNSVQLPKGFLDAGYPLPALIANNYGEMLSIPQYDSALLLSALILFVIVLFFNLISRILIHKTSTL